ncbi:MAG: histidine phosphatase family protein, partial [Marmoricola sp.]
MGMILMVRHGQASWGADDYDALSDNGQEQARLLGFAMAARGIVPTAVVHGGMRRHRETWDGMAQAAGWDLAPIVDEGWAEYDHDDVLSQVAPPATEVEGVMSPREVQTWVEAGTDRWTADEGTYLESFGTFVDRVDGALARTPRDGTVVVVTSGGPIALVTAGLLADGHERTALWKRLNIVCANTGVTRVIAGRRGLSLVTFNEDTHFDAHPKL